MTKTKALLSDRSGTSAVEFAIIAPVFICLLMTFLGYGFYLTTSSCIQQLAADAARTAIGGLTSAERKRLATDFVSAAAPTYAGIDSRKLTVTVADDVANPSQFTVSLVYDASTLPIWSLYAFVMPNNTIKRVATIRLGGI